MISKNITIINKLGLHARAAAKFVSCTTAFSSDINIERDGREVNGKSIMGVMMLAASKDSTITVTIDGEDEDAAMQGVENLIANRFGEEQ